MRTLPGQTDRSHFPGSLLRPIIRKIWPDPVESLEFVRTVKGDVFEADDESKLIDVAPTDDEDLSIEVNGKKCNIVME